MSSGRSSPGGSATAAALTSARREAISGRLVRGDRHQVIERAAGVDQGDLEVVVLERLDHRAGVEPEHPGELWRSAPATAVAPRRPAASRSASMFRARSTSNCDQVAAQGGDPFDQVVPLLDRSRACRRTSPGTGAP